MAHNAAVWAAFGGVLAFLLHVNQLAQLPSPGTDGSPLQMVHAHDWPVVLAEEWVLRSGCPLGRQFFFMWPLHVPPMDSTEAWFCEGTSKTTVTKKTSSHVHTWIKPLFCITLTNVPLANESPVAKPTLCVGRNISQERSSWETWFMGSHVPPRTLNSVILCLCFSSCN